MITPPADAFTEMHPVQQGCGIFRKADYTDRAAAKLVQCLCCHGIRIKAPRLFRFLLCLPVILFPEWFRRPILHGGFSDPAGAGNDHHRLIFE